MDSLPGILFSGPVSEIAGASVSRTALVIEADVSFDEWQKLGTSLATIEGSTQWWRGDWWAFGEHSYGERADQLDNVDADQRSQTWRVYGTVSRAFSPDRRREVLSWTHHRLVASLPDDVADDLLDRAEADKWSVRRLREAIAIWSGTEGKRRELSLALVALFHGIKDGLANIQSLAHEAGIEPTDVPAILAAIPPDSRYIVEESANDFLGKAWGIHG